MCLETDSGNGCCGLVCCVVEVGAPTAKAAVGKLSIVSSRPVVRLVAKLGTGGFDGAGRLLTTAEIRRHAAVGMQDGRVISTTEVPTDRGKTGVCELTGEVHSHLTRQSHLRTPVVCEQRP